MRPRLDRNFLIPCFAALCIASQAAAPAQGRIVGYFPEWGINPARNYLVSSIPADQLDVVNYGFAQIDASHRVTVVDTWAAIQRVFPENDPALPFQGNFNALLQLKKRAPHVKTMISVGGWSLSGPFSDAALTATSRATFSTSAVAFMKKYGFDGIDIDWEYPVSGGLKTGRPVDKQNYTLLLRQLRADLDARGALDGRRYLLTIAAPAAALTIPNLELYEVGDVCDWINVMTYDLHGDWDTTTDFHAPLFGRFGRNSTLDPACAHSAIDSYLQGGVPAEKLVLGLAFYGRGYEGVPAGTSHGLRQSFTGIPMGTHEVGSFDYWDIAQKLATQPTVWTRYYDNVAKSVFVYAPSIGNGTWIGYDDPQSLAAKVDYVKERRLGGVMFWELTGDVRTPSNSLLTAVETALKPRVALRIDSRHLSEGMGATATFRLANASHANRLYVLLGTFSGTTPGFRIGNLQVPINWDPLTDALLASANTPQLMGFVGALDGAGNAIATITAPPIGGGVGLDFHFAYVQYGATSFDFASNPVALRIVP